MVVRWTWGEGEVEGEVEGEAVTTAYKYVVVSSNVYNSTRSPSQRLPRHHTPYPHPLEHIPHLLQKRVIQHHPDKPHHRPPIAVDMIPVIIIIIIIINNFKSTHALQA